MNIKEIVLAYTEKIARASGRYVANATTREDYDELLLAEVNKHIKKIEKYANRYSIVEILLLAGMVIVGLSIWYF